ncbi:TPA: DUF1501 domain-containing protein [Vibrio vulnificus]|nr:DUF1501 domain-containing protein [Vibrio vulnificus]
MTMKRRDFLKHTAMMGMIPVIPQLVFSKKAYASPFSDYKAIVVISLGGGNDGFNTIVATEQYDLYYQARQKLAIPLNDLLPINTQGENTLALHPALDALVPLIDEGYGLPIMANGQCRGLDGDALPIIPSGSGNHSNMLLGMHTGFVNGEIPGGWAGRAVEHITKGALSTPHPLFSSNQTLRVTQSENYRQEVITPNGIASGFLSAWSEGARLRAMQYDVANPRENLFMRHNQNMLAEFTAPKEEFIPIFEQPVLDGFPNTTLGGKLERIARVIMHQQASVGHDRQVFACEQGGYDTHSGQLSSQAKRLKELGDAIAAFQNVMINAGKADEVALITISDFGRKFYSNGDGSGHGWATNSFVFSGAVKANIQVGTLDYSKGDKATTPSEQVMATLVHWFGVPENELELIFPWLARMDRKHLDFMGSVLDNAESLPIMGAVASHEHIDHSSGIKQIAEYAIDQRSDTKWSGKGIGVTFEATLSASALLSNLRLMLPNSSVRQYLYRVDVIGEDGATYPISEEYTPLTDNDYDWFELNCRSDCKNAKSVRITHFGNTDSRPDYTAFTGIAQIEIWGVRNHS